jgi:hypothetical protein
VMVQFLPVRSKEMREHAKIISLEQDRLLLRRRVEESSHASPSDRKHEE